ncbi:MAG: hypothetical protein LWW85_14910, partial [Marinilabiliales bacterium]|nr:hypothetical protein [Marinilabiliales bacterium]
MKTRLFTLQTFKPMEWIYIAAGVYCILLLLGLLSGCTVVRTDYSDKARKVATVYYYLPESLIKLTVTTKVEVHYGEDKKLNGSCKIIEQSFETSSEMIADTRYLLSLLYKPNALMTDDIKYAVNAKGLLETVNVTTDDRTSDIIAKLADAPKIILGSPISPSRSKKETIQTKEFTSVFRIRASTIGTEKMPISWNIVLINEMGIDGDKQSVDASFTVRSDEKSAASAPLGEILNGKDSLPTKVNGILTRPLRNLFLTIEPIVHGTGLDQMLPVHLTVADAAKLIVVPVSRTLF